MDISVILATYNRDDILQKTLKSFENLNTDGFSWELIIVDNCGLQSTQKLVESYTDLLPLKFLQETRPGKNYAISKGLSHSVGELLVFTDDDIVADKDWLLNMLIGSQNFPNYHMFGGKITPTFPPERALDQCINLEHPISKTAYGILDLGPEDQEITANNIWGANMAVKREVFDSGLAFDNSVGPSQKQNYTMGSEASLLIPAEKAGFKSIYLSKAHVLHQIRPEQTSIKWMKQRALRMGRGKAAIADEYGRFKTIAGIPRFIYKKLALSKLRSLAFLLTRNHNQYFDETMSYWTWLGVAQYHKSGPPLSLTKK
ncbi:glycosyltransferase family 2 protein [Marinobacter salinexigens]|uniref:Glycosyltransferase family 2 protein n=1 Tax=Marinobacter salinexigens TaxID=2919747 RepID=A0A5B0VKY5_9GAMM|nr:glycosyltransferase family 2 protein [Marinobacter salinexigens]KAA1175058.1 glycosyltransferase family 2 protein [Marinobacter salinexigens]